MDFSEAFNITTFSSSSSTSFPPSSANDEVGPKMEAFTRFLANVEPFYLQGAIIVEFLFGVRALLWTNVCLATGFTALADWIQQRQLLFRGKLLRYDWIRTRNQAISALPIGFIYHYWFEWLDGVFPDARPGHIFVKILLDLFVMSPLAWTSYFAALTLIERGSFRLFLNRAFKKGGKLLLAEWIVWPPAQTVNFYFLTTKYRVLFEMFIQLCFDTYLSYLMYDEDH